MKKHLRVFLVGFGIVVGLVCLLLFGAISYLQTPHAHRFILGKINGTIPGTISCEGIHFSLIKGQFEFKNVLLKGPFDDSLAGFERLFVDLSWFPFLKGDLTIASLILEKPWTSLRVDSQGKINLIRAFAVSKPEEEHKKTPEQEKGIGIPINVVIRSLKLAEGSFNYEMVAENLKAVGEAIDITASGNLFERSGNLILRIGKGRLDSPTIRTELDRSKLQAMLREGRIEPLFLELGTTSSKLVLSGNIDDVFSKPFADVALDLTVSLAEVAKSLHLAPALSGQVAGRLSARGAPDNPEVSVNLDYAGGIVSGIQIDHIELNSQLKDRLWTLNRFLVNAGSGTLNLEGRVDLRKTFVNGFLAPQRDFEAISYEIFLKQRGIKLEKVLAGANRSGGTVNSDLTVYGKGVSPQTLSATLALEVFAERVKAGHVAAPIDCHLITKASLDKGVARLKELRAEAGDIKLRSDGHFDLLSKQVNARATLEAPNLAGTLSPLGIREAEGALGLDATVSGSIKKPILDLTLQGSQLGFRDIRIGNVLLDASLEESGKLRIVRLDVQNQGSALHGMGSIQIFKDLPEFDPTLPLNLSLSMHPIEMKDFLSSELARGKIDGQLELYGSINAPQAAISLRGQRLVTKTARLGDLDLRARFSEGKLSLDEVKIQNQKSRLLISGTAQILERERMQPLKDPTFEVDIRGNPIFVEDFVDKLKGKVMLTTNLEGSVRYPRGTVELHGTGLDLGIQKLEELTLLCKLDGEKIWLNPLQVSVAPGEVIEGTGWFSLQKSYQIALVSKGISLQNIDRIREQNIAQGKLDLHISGKGTLEDPQIEGDVGVKRLQVHGKSLDDFKLRFDVADQLARISGTLNFGLNGSFHLEKKDFSASLRFDETDISPYLDIAGQPELSGTLTGQILARGNAAAIQQVQASIDFSKMDLFIQEKELVRARNLQISLKDEEISIPALQLVVLKEGQIDIKGRGKRNGPLAFEVGGHIPLQVISLFVEDLADIRGDLLLSASIGGTQSRPDMQAEIGLDKIGFTVPILLQRLHDLRGRIQITPQAITIHKIEGEIDTGRFAVAGKIDLDQLQPAKVVMAVNAHALPIQVPDTLYIVLNTDLKIHGTPEKSMIQGEAVILEGTYYRDVNLSPLQMVGEKKREEAPPPSDLTQPFLRNMRLDISVKGRNPFVVDNNLAQLNINPDLRLSGKFNNPIITGRASVESGTVTYQGKTFVVKKGVLDFLNPYKIEPTIDIESQVRIRRWTIFLKISGAPDVLTFELTSDPSEEHGDIVSLLVFGRTTRELIAGEGGSSQSTEQMLAMLLASTAGEDIKKATGLDILEVETQGEDEEASDLVKVTIGKELSRRMTLKYAVESKDGEMTQRAIAEYKLLENMLMSGFQGSRGIFGATLQFRLEFR